MVRVWLSLHADSPRSGDRLGLLAVGGGSQMMAPLEITIARSKDSVELTIGGDLDLRTVERFKRVLRDAVYEAHQTVNLDLSQLTFICSVGIGSLVSARQLAVEEGVTLRIVKASDQVELVLDLMAMGDYFF